MTNEKIPRTCATCACYWINPDIRNVTKQGFCRLNPAAYGEASIEVPRLDKEGKQMLSARGNIALSDTVKQPVYMYPPMSPELTCFGGWRPIGIEPGSKWMPEMDHYKGLIEHVLASMGITRGSLDS